MPADMNELDRSERLKKVKELMLILPLIDLNFLKKLFPSNGSFKFKEVEDIIDFIGIDSLYESVYIALKNQYKGRQSDGGNDLGIEIIRIYKIITSQGPILIHDAGRDMYWGTRDPIIAVKGGNCYRTDRDFIKTKIKHDVITLKTTKNDFYFIKSSIVDELTTYLMNRWFNVIEEDDKYEKFIRSKLNDLYVFDDKFYLNRQIGKTEDEEPIMVGCDVRVVYERDKKKVIFEGQEYKASICKLIWYCPIPFLPEETYVKCNKG